jgi:hypothetical protein
VKELAERYPDMQFVPYHEFGSTHGADEHDLIEHLGKRLHDLEVDVVISGMGC